MTLKLYYAPRTRAARPRWLLEELEVPYEIVRLDLSKGDHKKPEYLAVHPLGVVPALEDGAQTMMESVAICAHLADKFPEKGLAPKIGSPDRGPYYQWLFFTVGTMEPRIINYAMNKEGDPAVVAETKKGVDEAVSVVTKALGKNQFIMGDRFSAADVVLGSLLAWARSMGFLKGNAELEAYVNRLTDRPAYQRAQS